MGFVEVIKNLRTILGNISFCKKDITTFQPDCLVLIDYPGFNMRIASHAKKEGIKVIYYISPQIWAWNQKRAYKIKRIVDRMLTILPFEQEFYARFGMEVDYVGHPLLDAIENNRFEIDEAKFRSVHQLGERPLVLILPGSRKQEVEEMLPVMLKQISHFSEYQFVVGAAPSFTAEFFSHYLSAYPELKVVYQNTYQLMQFAHAAIVTSGTATLETALFKTPMVVCYRGSFLSYHIARWLVKVNYISLVNLIADREVVKELIQQEFTEGLLRSELGKLLKDRDYRSKMLDSFEVLIGKLGKGASENAASIIVDEVTA
jgi:lipid-A-disaccharide synthase